MYQFIHKYFAVHKKVTLPGIGSFVAETQSAKLDFIERTLHAPVYSVRFDKYDDADEAFYIFLSNEAGVSAIERFEHYTNALREQLKKDNIIVLQGIGILTQNASGYSFVADNSIQRYFPAIAADRVIRQNAAHAVRVGEDHRTSTEMHEQLKQKEVIKDKWYIAAAILGVIGVAAIAFYYLIRN